MHNILPTVTPIVCGQVVQNLRIETSKKCVRFSPTFHKSTVTIYQSWIINLITPLVPPVSFTSLSTTTKYLFASVGMVVFPIFHTTYNNHYKFI